MTKVIPIPTALMMQKLNEKGLRVVHRPANLVSLRIEREKRKPLVNHTPEAA